MFGYYISYQMAQGKDLYLFAVGGGMFSLLHQFLEGVLETQEEPIESLRVGVHKHIWITNPAIFDNVFEHDERNYKIIYKSETSHGYTKANCFSQYDTLKDITQKLKIQPSILNAVDAFCKHNAIGEDTLGIHLRLTDMNIHHASEYGVLTFESFYKKTLEFLQKYPHIKNIFIASDNEESIRKFQSLCTTHKVISFPNSTRISLETDDNYEHQRIMLNDPNLYVQNMTEVLILSRCGYLIHRISDFANFAILKSTSFQEISCLN
jgi:hypothetical protein